MSQGSSWAIPYILDPQNLVLDVTVSFVVSVLLAVMINAEGQAWVSTMLGDTRPGAKDRFHFNAFLHLDITGSICYLVGGFGWPRTLDIDPGKFKYPRLYTIISRFAGPFANILMANVAASLVFVIKFLNMDPLVFMMVLGVNVTTAVYNLIPIPPLAASTFITVWLPDRPPKLKWLINFSGPFLIVGIFLAERVTGQGILSPYLNPIVRAVVNFIVG
jgi:Zn-dependent protease